MNDCGFGQFDDVLSPPEATALAESLSSAAEGRAGARRRVLHIEYADSLDLRPGIRLALC